MSQLPPPSVGPPVAPAPPSSTGRTVMLWGGAAGGLITLVSLLGQDPIGLLAGLMLVTGSIAGGITIDQRAEATRHQRVLDLLMHDPSVLITQITTQGNLDLERLRGMIKQQHIQLTEPRAIRADLVRLSQALTSLQLAAWDKSEKDPSFRAIFEQVSGMVRTTQEQTDSLLADLLSDSDSLTEDQQRRYEAVSKLFLELLDKWIGRL